MRLILLILLFPLVLSADEKQLKGDVLRLNTTAVPSVCTNGQIRNDSADSKYKLCLGNAWTILAANPIIQSKSTTYTILISDDIVFGDSSGGTFTFTLPTAVGNDGKVITIKKIEASFNAITIDGNASETINGSATTTLNTDNETIKIVSDGSNWEILSRNFETAWVAWTPTGLHTANVTYSGYYRRLGQDIELNVKVAFSGAPTPTGVFTLNVPAGLSIDTTVAIGETNNITFGKGNALDVGSTDQYDLQTRITNSSSFTFRTPDINATYLLNKDELSQASPYAVASGDIWYFRIKVPISGWK